MIHWERRSLAGKPSESRLRRSQISLSAIIGPDLRSSTDEKEIRFHHITYEIDKERHQRALANFAEAGLLDYIDARLADAHDLVKDLRGPFDFVFCDADKEWYKQYFVDVYPKLEKGGCYTAHNVSLRSWGMGEGTRQFYDYIRSLSYMKTTVVHTPHIYIGLHVGLHIGLHIGFARFFLKNYYNMLLLFYLLIFLYN